MKIILSETIEINVGIKDEYSLKEFRELLKELHTLDISLGLDNSPEIKNIEEKSSGKKIKKEKERKEERKEKLVECNRCHKKLSRENFSMMRKNPNGLNKYCKKCIHKGYLRRRETILKSKAEKRKEKKIEKKSSQEILFEMDKKSDLKETKPAKTTIEVDHANPLKTDLVIRIAEILKDNKKAKELVETFNEEKLLKYFSLSNEDLEHQLRQSQVGAFLNHFAL